MRCLFCHHDNPDNSAQANFCSSCGAQLKASSSSVPAPQPQSWEPVTDFHDPPVSSSLPVALPPASNYSHSSQSDSGTLSAIIALIAFFGLPILVFLFFLFAVSSLSRKTSDDPFRSRAYVNGKEVGPGDPAYHIITQQIEEDEKRRKRVEQDKAQRSLPVNQYPVQSSKPVLRKIPAHKTALLSLLHDGKLLIADNQQGKLILWNPLSGKTISLQQKTVPNKSENPVFEVNKAALTPDGALLACHSTSGIGLWDTSTGQIRGFLKGKIKVVDFLTFSNSRQLIIWGKGETNKEVWDINTRKIIRSQISSAIDLIDHKAPYETWLDYSQRSSVRSPDGHWFVSGGNYGRIIIVDMRTRNSKRQQSEAKSDVNALAFSPDSRHLISGAGNTLIEWDVVNNANGSKQKTLLESEYFITRATYSPDGEWVAVMQGEWKLALIHLPSDKNFDLQWPNKNYSNKNERVRDMAFSSDGTRLQCILPDGQLAIWRFKKPLLPLVVKTVKKAVQPQR